MGDSRMDTLIERKISMNKDQKILRIPPKVPRPTPAPFALSPVVSEIEGALEEGSLELMAAEQRLDDLLQRGTPLIEDIPGSEHERIVTFLDKDAQAMNVLLFINRITDETNLEQSLMKPVGQTSFRALSLRMRSDWRASYCLLRQNRGERAPWQSPENQLQLRAALDRGQLDSANPHRCVSNEGHLLSLLELGDAPYQPFVTDAQPEALIWRESKSSRKFSAHLMGEVHANLPLVIVLDGEKWAQQGLLSMAREAVKSGYLEDFLLVMVHSGGYAQRWEELDGSFPYADFLADEVIPEAIASLGVQSYGNAIVVGQSLGGLSAILAVWQRPEVFSAAVSSSASLWLETMQVEFDRVSKNPEILDRYSPKLLLEVGEQEWVLLPLHQKFAENLKRSGFDYEFHTYNGGHDFACWRGSILPRLRKCFKTS